ncbi:MAG TPA: tRNA epoxyqueuosine(34) reductase QueG [Gammaproteobacteria bacterium]
MCSTKNPRDLTSFPEQLRAWAQELGFQQLGIANIDLSAAEQSLQRWLAQGYHGEMAYMQRHGSKRSRPAELVEGTLSIIAVRMNYLPEAMTSATTVLATPELGYISRYALGRDYHKLLRKRLQQLAERISAAIGPFGFRVFVDSAPVLEKAIGAKAGIGWQGKHSNLLTRQGSWFFLGEIYTDLPLPVEQPIEPHCGSCTACIDVCPTKAIVAPYEVDARRCISYLTIELHGAIPEALRPLLGNRIYGCDDCQLVCPWNRFAQLTVEHDFLPRHGFAAPQLVELFGWEEAVFLHRSEGSPLRRLGYERWLRNIAVALGNATTTPAVVAALQSRVDDALPLVREHTRWGLHQHQSKE